MAASFDTFLLSQKTKDEERRKGNYLIAGLPRSLCELAKTTGEVSIFLLRFSLC